MDDLISRQMVIDIMWDALYDYEGEYDERSSYGVLCDLEKKLMTLPSVQLQPEIIRCKDCKWHGGKYYCRNTDTWGFDDDDFCSDAERRIDERLNRQTTGD